MEAISAAAAASAAAKAAAVLSGAMAPSRASVARAVGPSELSEALLARDGALDVDAAAALRGALGSRRRRAELPGAGAAAGEEATTSNRGPLAGRAGSLEGVCARTSSLLERIPELPGAGDEATSEGPTLNLPPASALEATSAASAFLRFALARFSRASSFLRRMLSGAVSAMRPKCVSADVRYGPSPASSGAAPDEGPAAEGLAGPAAATSEVDEEAPSVYSLLREPGLDELEGRDGSIGGRSPSGTGKVGTDQQVAA